MHVRLGCFIGSLCLEGVPQGRIYEPLLFFINNLQEVTNIQIYVSKIVAFWTCKNTKEALLVLTPALVGTNK